MFYSYVISYFYALDGSVVDVWIDDYFFESFALRHFIEHGIGSNITIPSNPINAIELMSFSSKPESVRDKSLFL
jgi:hypothetical protein